MKSPHNNTKNKIAVIVSSEVEVKIIQTCLKHLSGIFSDCVFFLLGNLDKDDLGVIKNSATAFRDILYCFDYNSKTTSIAKFILLALSFGMKRVEKVILIIDPFCKRLYTKDKLFASFVSLNKIGVYDIKDESIVFYPRINFLFKTIKDISLVYVQRINPFIKFILSIFILLLSPVRLIKMMAKIIKKINLIPNYIVFLLTLSCFMILKLKFKLVRRRA